MPGWLISALRLIGGTPARAAITGASLGAVGADIIPSFPSILGGDDGRPRRRRRRRALTASDRADIAFITGILGTTAGKNFALLIATRTSA